MRVFDDRTTTSSPTSPLSVTIGMYNSGHEPGTTENADRTARSRRTSCPTEKTLSAPIKKHCTRNDGAAKSNKTAVAVVLAAENKREILMVYLDVL